MYYILDENNEPVKVENTFDWSNRFNEVMRRTAWDDINGTTISTVFLGIDHSFGGEIPLLWETMCFSGNPDYNDYQERYTSYADAVEGHKQCVESITKNEPLNYRKTIKFKI